MKSNFNKTKFLFFKDFFINFDLVFHKLKLQLIKNVLFRRCKTFLDFVLREEHTENDCSQLVDVVWMDLVQIKVFQVLSYLCHQHFPSLIFQNTSALEQSVLCFSIKIRFSDDLSSKLSGLFDNLSSSRTLMTAT